MLYEPASGSVDLPRRERFATTRLGLAGWDRPWFLVAPGNEAALGARDRARLLAPVPRANPGAVMLRK